MHMLVSMYYCIYMFSYGPYGPEIKHYYYYYYYYRPTSFGWINFYRGTQSTICGGFSTIYFRGLGLWIRIVVLVMVRVRVWVRLRVSAVLWYGKV